jgi:hypothetical protein
LIPATAFSNTQETQQLAVKLNPHNSAEAECEITQYFSMSEPTACQHEDILLSGLLPPAGRRIPAAVVQWWSTIKHTRSRHTMGVCKAAACTIQH